MFDHCLFLTRGWKSVPKRFHRRLGQKRGRWQQQHHHRVFSRPISTVERRVVRPKNDGVGFHFGLGHEPRRGRRCGWMGTWNQYLLYMMLVVHVLVMQLPVPTTISIYYTCCWWYMYSLCNFQYRPQYEREISIYYTWCWWYMYSLCNFQYRPQHEHTCSDPFQCWIYTIIYMNIDYNEGYAQDSRFFSMFIFFERWWGWRTLRQKWAAKKAEVWPGGWWGEAVPRSI